MTLAAPQYGVIEHSSETRVQGYDMEVLYSVAAKKKPGSCRLTLYSVLSLLARIRGLLSVLCGFLSEYHLLLGLTVLAFAGGLFQCCGCCLEHVSVLGKPSFCHFQPCSTIDMAGVPHLSLVPALDAHRRVFSVPCLIYIRSGRTPRPTN